MSSVPCRELIPQRTVVYLIAAVDSLQSRLRATAEQTQLLDDTGKVPAAPSYPKLLQHAADAQARSRDVLALTADFARSDHSTTRVGTTVLVHLATAATLSSHAVSAFAETAETALSLLRSSDATGRQFKEHRMAIDHAMARSHLRRSAQSLHEAAKALNDHLDFHHFFRAPTPQQAPTPPPPGPNGPRR